MGKKIERLRNGALLVTQRPLPARSPGQSKRETQRSEKKLKAWSFLRDKHATGLEKDRIHIPGETWTFREHWRSACCVRAVVRIRSSRSLRAVPSFHRRDPEARWPNVVSLFELRPAVMQTTAGCDTSISELRRFLPRVPRGQSERAFVPRPH